jgi:hypothetical protein
MSYLLTLEAVKTAARAAYEGEYLGFQRGEPDCLYKGITGAPCAVGAALPADLLKVIAADPELNGASVINLAEKGLITFASGVEADAILAIQQAHDDLVGASPSEKYYASCLATFKERIGAA